MTLEELKKIVGCVGLWTPTLRAKSATLRVRVKVVGARQTCGRPELQIAPTTGDGAAWVYASSFHAQ